MMFGLDIEYLKENSKGSDRYLVFGLDIFIVL